MKVDRYVLQEPAATLLARFEEAATFDTVAEKKSKHYGIGCITAFVLTFFGFPLAGAAAALFPPLIILAGVAPLTLIVCAVKWYQYQSHDIDNRKVGSVVRLLKVLKADIPADSPVDLTVDFRDYKAGGTKTAGEGYVGEYEHEWLQITVHLFDGTAAQLKIVDRVKRKEKPKRKKNKVAERVQTTAEVSLRLARAHGDAVAAQQRLAALAPPPPLTVHRVTGSGRNLFVALRAPQAYRLDSRRVSRSENWDKMANGDTLLQTLRFAFRGLAARAVA